MAIVTTVMTAIIVIVAIMVAMERKAVKATVATHRGTGPR
jgi:hypothetical protein